MSVSADMYIVISLMFAVFAAVAAVGTSVVLGAGYERLRAGFEIIRKQTGFFADAIHKLDERTKALGEETGAMKEAVSSLSVTVERVDKQTGFFSDAIQSIEQRMSPEQPKREEPVVEKDEPILPREMDYLTMDQDEPNMDILNDMQFMTAGQKEAPRPEQVAKEKPQEKGLSNLLSSYFRGESAQEVTFH